MNKLERKYQLIRQLESLGFSFEEAQKLRRIEMTLHRWNEQECGDGNDYASWSIERDETTGKPGLIGSPWSTPRTRLRLCKNCLSASLNQSESAQSHE